MASKDMTLIGIKDIKRRYGIGRVVAALLIQTLPHVRIGKRLLVFAGDVEEFLQKAAESGLDIPTYLREYVRRKKVEDSGGDK